MKKSVVLFVCLWLSTFAFIQAQEKMPQAISYQAVARDTVGKVLTGKNISVKVEILKGSATGAAVYTETHGVKSTATGTVNLLIGQGTAGTGTFAGVDWATGSYFLELSMDDKGGTDYKVVSTTQMLPVPYALYAEKAGAVENGESVIPKRKGYVIYSDNNDIYNLIAGKEKAHHEESDNGVEFEFGLMYLDGIDLKMDVEITDIPAGASISEINYTSNSTPWGRYIDMFLTNIPQGDSTAKLLIKDKDGKVVEQYTINLYRENIPEEI